MTKLQVLVAAYGPEALQRMEAGSYPRVEGVEYIVAWQLPNGDAPVPASLQRSDIQVIKTATRGSSINRNIALDAATAPLVLMSDDDLIYTAEGLLGVIDAFARHPEADVLTFRYESELARKEYVDFEFDWRRPTRRVLAYVSCIEIAARLDSLRSSGVRFDLRFGIAGTHFICGEEDMLMVSVLKARLRALFIPHTICSHPSSSTSERLVADPRYIETKGGVFRCKCPLSWPLRMLTHALRNRRAPSSRRLSTRRYLAAWLRGARRLATSAQC